MAEEREEVKTMKHRDGSLTDASAQPVKAGKRWGHRGERTGHYHF